MDETTSSDGSKMDVYEAAVDGRLLASPRGGYAIGRGWVYEWPG